MNKEYYVYVYIDPRNYEEFYYGKGKGSRKDSHEKDDSDNEKTRRIKSILSDNLKPIIRVVAANLTEEEAFLIEKTLLWKLGKTLTNISSGYYADKFRPKNTMHLELSGFDFQNNLYYYNIGEGETRNWDDYKEYGFISAGQGTQWRDPMLKFKEGDIIAAYLKSKGFVGIGRILSRAKRVNEVTRGGVPLCSLPLVEPNLSSNSDSLEKSEYICDVQWLTCVDRKEAKWKPKSGLFTTQLIRASLDNQPKTIKFLSESFNLDIQRLLI